MGRPAYGWADRSLPSRIATAVVGGPLLVAAVWYGGSVLASVVVLLSALGAVEYHRLTAQPGAALSPALVGGALAFPALAALGRWEAAPAVLAAGVAAAAVETLASAGRGGGTRHAGAVVLGMVYVGALLAHLLLLRLEAGAVAALFVLGAIWVNDAAAYGVGTAWGRHRLLPAISPGKSVEGLVAGLVAAAAAAALAAGPLGLEPARAVILVLGVAAAAVVGDLWESALKRGAGVKDSGGILPGHGGVLDRFDAVLFGVPAGYYLWRLLM